MPEFERSYIKRSHQNKALDGESSEDEYVEAKRRKKANLPAKKEEKVSKPFKKVKTYKADVMTDLKIVMNEDCALLNCETVCSDLAVLGCITEISDLAVTVALPGSLFAVAPKSLVSPNSSSSLTKELNVCQIVACKVQAKKLSLDNTWRIIVALDPRRVNSHIPHHVVDVGMSLMGTVQSVEDHGYVIDCGIPNLRAFLPTVAAKNWCKTFQNGEALETGQLIRCFVCKQTSSNAASNIELTTDPSSLSGVLNSNKNVSIVPPGSLVKCTLKKPLSDGAKVSGKGLRFPGYINDFHRESKNKKKMNEEFSATILYLEPSGSRVMLGSLSCFQLLKFRKAEFPPKAVIENAKVESVKKNGVMLKILKDGKYLKGFIPISDAERLITDDTNDDEISESNIFNRLQKKLKKEKFISCHVVCFSYMDQIYQCSVKGEYEEAEVSLDSLRLKDIPSGFKIGNIFSLTVSKVTSKFLCVKTNEGEIDGVVPFDQLSDNIDLTPLLFQSYCEGDTIETAVFYLLDEKVPLFSIKPSVLKFFKENLNSLPDGWSSLSEGMVVPLTVSEVINRRISGVVVATHVQSFPEVLVTDEDLLLPEFPSVRPTCKQTILGQVTRHDDTELSVNCQLFNVWNSDLSVSVEFFQNFLDEMGRIQRLNTGSKVQCIVKGKNSDGSWKLNFLVYTGISGLLPAEFCKTKKINTGMTVSTSVLWDDPIENTVHVTCEDDMNVEESENFKKLRTGTRVTCKILYKQFGFNVAVIKCDSNPSFNGQVVYLLTKLHLNDFQDILKEASANIGDSVDVHILSNENNVVIGILVDALELVKTETAKFQTFQSNKRKYAADEEKSEKVPRKKSKLAQLEQSIKKPKSDQPDQSDKESKSKQTEKIDKKSKLLMMLNDLVEENSDDEEKVEAKKDEVKKKGKKDKNSKKNKAVETSKSSDESCDDVEAMPDFISVATEKKTVTPKLTDPGFDWNASLTTFQEMANGKNDSESEEEEEKTSSKQSKKNKKLTPAERRNVSKQKEQKIKQAEEELLNAEKNPQSADHFERLLLASPNNSAIWMKYMAYHLQGTEIDKARNVAKQALQRINQREENERLNIWTALFNLENMFGTPESFQKCLIEALQTNNEWQIYSRVMQIYVSSQKTKELEKLMENAIKKLRKERNLFEIFTKCGEFLLQAGLAEKSRSMMQRALSVLPSNQHVDLTIKFAHLENRYGSQERAQTLFEHILTSFPKRVDVWISYVDLLVKANRIDLARQVMERAVALQLKPFKMRSIYKKWLSFEKDFGTEETFENVKEKIKQYVECD